MTGTTLRMRVGAVLLAALVPLGADADAFKVRLTPVPIDSTSAKLTTGSGAATAELDGTRLKLAGSFAGLKGPATIARLHDGRAMGVRGPAIADVTVPQASEGSLSANLTLTPQQAEDLRRGRLYLQIHSNVAPDGNLWGWLLP